MDDPLPDTPALEFTTPPGEAAGVDALQLGPADMAAAADTAFGIARPDPARPEPAAPVKPSKPVTAEANHSVVAALMGRPIKAGRPKPAKGPDAPAAKTTAGPKAEPEQSASPPALWSPLPVLRGRAREGVYVPPTTADPLPDHQEKGPEACMSGTDSAPASDPADDADAFLARLEAKARAAGVTFPPPGPVTAAAAVEMPVAVRTSAPAAVAPAPAVSQAELAGVKVPARPFVAGVAAPRQARPVAPVWPDVDPAVAPRPRRPEPKAVPDALPVQGGVTWLTIPLMCVGIAVVACAVLVPAAEDTRRDTYELARIERDVAYFQQQSDVNRDFLQRVDTDATLAERLAMRQLHQTRPGVRELTLATTPQHFGASPYALTRVDPPAALPPYRPVPGLLTDVFLDPARQRQTVGVGLLVAGAGLLLGGGTPRRGDAA